MKNRLFILCLALLTISTAGTVNAKNEKPFVIPEIRHWQGGEGAINISANTKVFYTDGTYETLVPEK